MNQALQCLKNARQLVDYISTLNDFSLDTQELYTYGHMGAILADAILQAGLNYNRVVVPRITYILQTYPDAKTTSSFQEIIQTYGTANVLRWQHPEKPRRLSELTYFLRQSEVETEAELREWLLNPQNPALLLNLKGIGPKTVDYLKILVNVSTVAVDRHMIRFVKQANIECENYTEVKRIIEFAADLMDVPRPNLDHTIWTYLSNQK